MNTYVLTKNASATARQDDAIRNNFESRNLLNNANVYFEHVPLNSTRLPIDRALPGPRSFNGEGRSWPLARVSHQNIKKINTNCETRERKRVRHVKT